jgi:CheY-like chemotaxis protein
VTTTPFAAGPPGFTRPRVLVVDDDPDIRGALADMLSVHHYDVVGARHGAEAFERLKTVSVDLIILDLLMPIMDGREFLRLYAGPDGRTPVPVIALSAVPYRGAPGALVVLPKPVDTSSLLAAMSRAMRRS